LKSIFHRYRNSSSFISVYGPTETTCICSYAKVEESDFLNQELFISLGSFAPFFDISLLHLSINNLDIRGELCLSGSNTIDGYLDKSNDKDKLLSIDGRHLYRTGDFVKINLKDNKVYFLGRVDNQIKKMGIRIELEEIEAKIEENLFVQRAMCIYNSENKEIICFVESASKLEVDSLTDFIREKLPKYMIPDKFISVNMIPMNKNGKKDRLKALVDYMSGK
jgi:D-alanine--poly(phosphoribitol) ligase subunit 1